MQDDKQLKVLGEQIHHLVRYITKIKTELAAIKHPKSRVDHFNTVADQLNTICESTEDATNTIMESAEDILNNVDELSGKIKYDEAQTTFNAIQDNTNKIFESCSFHDLTGQRISKIVRIMNRLEGTLDSLVEIVGREGLAEIPMDEDETIEDAIGMHDGDIAMHGPQTAGQEVSQDDIDALFGGGGSGPCAGEDVSQDAIDSLFDNAPAQPEKPAPAQEPVSQDDIDNMFDNADPTPPPSKEEKPKKAPAKQKEDVPAAGKEVSQDDIDKLFG